MNRFVALLILVLGVCAVPARAALVYDGWATGPGGLSTPYPAVNPEVYAGFVEMNFGGTTVLAMSDDYNARSNVGESWPMTLYTYADVMAGAPVRFSREKYSEVGSNFWLLFNLVNVISYPGYASTTSLTGALNQVMAYDPVNFLGFLAEQNQGVWLTMNPSLSFPSWPYGPPSCQGCQPTYDWSNDFIVASGGPGRDEYLIPLAGQNITIASAPLPPAAWLLGSGLLGLISVARKRHKAPH